MRYVRNLASNEYQPQPSRQLIIPLADPVQTERKPNPLFRRLENDKRRGLGGAELPSSLSSITTSATQPLGRQRTNRRGRRRHCRVSAPARTAAARPRAPPPASACSSDRRFSARSR